MVTSTETSDRVLRLIQVLLTRTEAGEISWQRADGPGTFAYAGAGGSVILDTEDGDGQRPFRLRILDTAGIEVDRRTSWNEQDDLAALYQSVRARLNVSAHVLDNLLAELQSA